MVALFLAAAASIAGSAQQVRIEVIGGPLVGPLPFLNAPFSAEAITTVNYALPNGTRLDRTSTARYYRDSNGRVRVEQLMEGLQAPKTVSERHIRLLVYANDRERHWPYRDLFSLDPMTRTARDGLGTPGPLAAGGGLSAGVPIGGARYLHVKRAQDWLRYENPPGLEADAIQYEKLGTRDIEGVETIGQRITLTFPPGYFAGYNDPVAVVDAQWISRQLFLVIAARYSDSRTGVVDYRLTNLRRADPSPALFVVPRDYKLLDPLSAGATDDPWMADMPLERYIADLAAGRLKP